MRYRAAVAQVFTKAVVWDVNPFDQWSSALTAALTTQVGLPA